MEELFESWETPAPQPDLEAELKKMRRSLRRRNWKIVLTSVILVITVLIGAVKFGIPALEKQYWDPTVCTYLEDIPDLELTMVTYNELFGDGTHLMSLDIQKTGFADYTLNAVFCDWARKDYLTELSCRNASISKGALHLPSRDWLSVDYGQFLRPKSSSGQEQAAITNRHTREILKALPEYIDVYACITFPEDLTMEQLLQLTYRSQGKVDFLWAVLRIGKENEYYSRCGVHLTDYRSDTYDPAFWEDSAYPKLFVDRWNWDESDMEQHIQSMLRFSADQVLNGTGILPHDDCPNYYLQVLDYMEENGIKTYGAYVLTSPQTLLKMLDDNTAVCISLQDAVIGL